MLHLVLFLPDGPLLGSASVINTDGSTMSAYEASVFGTQHEPLGTGIVFRYARWSAPPYDLVLRGVCRALFGAEDRIDEHAAPGALDGCGLEARLDLVPAGFEAARRRLMHWHLERSGSDFVCEVLNHETERVETKQMPGWGAEPVNAWVLTLRAWCVLLWGQPRAGPRFPALDIPLHGVPPRQYIRMRDLPDHVRPAFGRRMRGSACPYVEGVPDAVYPWDWTEFLAGRR